MKFRLALGAPVLLFAACLSAPPASAPTDKTPTSSSGVVDCATLKIHNKAELDACNQQCKSDQREQQASCGDPNCQTGIGTATRVCLGKCDDGQKSAKQAKCYKEN